MYTIISVRMFLAAGVELGSMDDDEVRVPSALPSYNEAVSRLDAGLSRQVETTFGPEVITGPVRDEPPPDYTDLRKHVPTSRRVHSWEIFDCNMACSCLIIRCMWCGSVSRIWPLGEDFGGGHINAYVIGRRDLKSFGANPALRSFAPVVMWCDGLCYEN